MLLLTTTSDKIQLVTTGSPVAVDVHTSWADKPTGDVTLGRLNTKITAGAPTTTDIVPAPAASTTRNVKAIHVANVHASASTVVTLQHTDGTNVVQLESVTLLAGERISYRDGVGMRVIDAFGLEKLSTAGPLVVAKLQADLANTTVTAAKVTGLDVAVGIGTWKFEYLLYYSTVITTTGIKFGVNHTGTVAPFLYNLRTVTTLATAADGTGDQDVLTTTGGLYNVWAARAKSTTAPMITAGVDTNAGDMFAIIEGLCAVTAAGNLELYSASEVAASSTSVKAGSSLVLTKIG